MSNTETAIREAAKALHDAIEAGKAEGLAVTWPLSAAELPRLAVSRKAKPKEKAVPVSWDDANGVPATEHGDKPKAKAPAKK